MFKIYNIMCNIAIFASGNGTNAENIISFFLKHEKINIKLILSDNTNAFVLKRAKKHNIPSIVFSKKELKEKKLIINLLNKYNINFIVLAGFLQMVPEYLIRQYARKIINIHPALLPKYGGKGMYGINVYKAILENNEKETGISIHYVNEKYDEGEIIFQTKCPVTANDTPETLAEKVYELEHKYFPRVIESLLK